MGDVRVTQTVQVEGRQPGVVRHGAHRPGRDEVGRLEVALVHQALERRLGGVTLDAEHGLAEESAAQMHAVQTTSESSLAPGFHRVRNAEVMQRSG